jgi:flagellar operon protein
MITPIQLRALHDPAQTSGTPPGAQPAAAGAFARALQSELAPPPRVKFSAHAEHRMRERGVELTQSQLDQIGDALDLVGQKGGRQTLLILDGLALVASVPNRTVITALGNQELDNAVFTNIDSAVLIGSEEKAEPDTIETGPDPAWGSPLAADRLTRPTN